MKKILFYLIYVMIPLCSFSQATELSKDECNTKIRAIWENSSKKEAKQKVSQLCLANPNNSASLLNLYFLRSGIDKIELKSAIDKLSTENESDAYAKSLKYYIENEQIKIGDRFTDFKATTSTGETFILSEVLKSKDVLLIFDGLSCVSESVIQELIYIDNKIDKKKVEIISFIFAKNADELMNELKSYKIPWLGVSDFKQDHSKTKINYNVQGRPTYIYIDSTGKVLVNEPGALSKKAMKLLKKHI